MRWPWVTLAVGLIGVSAGGCAKPQFRGIGKLPAPVFGEENGDRVVAADDGPRWTVVPPAPANPPPAPAPALAVPPPAPPGRADRAWIPPVRDNTWRYIVIHHSATARDNAAMMDAFHRNVRGWDELGYHFVIGNGSASGDGQIEVGSRWRKQKHGAHCKTTDERFNDFGIGICLVGNFESARPSAAQLDSVHRLVDFLATRYHIPATNIIGHGEAVARAREGGTKCPGRLLDMDGLRQTITRMAARH